MSASAVVKFNAYTKPMVIRCANLSDRGPRAHEFATKAMGLRVLTASVGAAIHQQAQACLRFEGSEPKRPIGASELLQRRVAPFCLPR